MTNPHDITVRIHPQSPIPLSVSSAVQHFGILISNKWFPVFMAFQVVFDVRMVVKLESSNMKNKKSLTFSRAK